MRRWTRATTDTWCGLCSAVIRAGEPVLEIALPAATRRRCERCAGPADLDQLEADDVRQDACTPLQPGEPRSSHVARPSRSFAPRGRARQLVTVGEDDRDWKRAQSGDED